MAMTPLRGTLLDSDACLTLDDVCHACSVRTEWIVELVEEGILEPSGDKRIEWKFSGESISRVQIAWRLQHDLEINLAGVALAIDLLQEIDNMRSRLRQRGALHE